MERDTPSGSWLGEPAGAWHGRPTDAGAALPDGVLQALARRMCAQGERTLILAERLRAGEQRPGALADAGEIAFAARRTLRDGENLLVLSGGRPERPTPVSGDIAHVLAGAVAGASDPSAVSVAAAPSASFVPGVAVTATQIITELLTYAAKTTAPGTRVDVVGRWAGDGGVTVELRAKGAGLPWYEAEERERELAGTPAEAVPAPRIGLFLAARLARHCGARVELQVPAGASLPPGTGLVALVRFPREAVESSAADPAPVYPSAWESAALPANGAPTRSAPVSAESVPADLVSSGRVPAGTGGRRGSSAVVLGTASSAEELFGSFDVGGSGSGDVAGTPIFAEVASAWFRTGDDLPAVNGHDGTGLADSWLDGGPGPGTGNGAPRNWVSGGDEGWRLATERAARAEEEELPLTSSGLPQRRPGRQMVPPPLREMSSRPVVSTEREPEQVRRRLATYQRGLEAGRHRADDAGGEDGAGSPAGSAVNGTNGRSSGSGTAVEDPAVGGVGGTGVWDEERETAGGWGSTRSPEQDTWRSEPWLERDDDPWGRHD
ncbi:MAG: ATP-binding protein [Pseudonocardia sp.]|nr:ATP-binding protein [Pseudonocardia sp.]